MLLNEKIAKKGFTNKEFAKKIGTDAPMVSRFSNYKCLPIPKMMREICDILDCDVEDIYEGKELYYKHRKPVSLTSQETYKMTVRLSKDKQAIIRKALKRCGYRDITDWINKCIKRLEKQYKIILEYEKNKEKGNER